MDESGFEADPYSPAGTVQQTGALARGLGRRHWGKVAVWLIVTVIVFAPVASLLVIWLSHDPNPNVPAWQRAVDRALVGATPDGLCVSPSAGNSQLPGFGTVVAQCVLSTGSDNVQVRFVHGTGLTEKLLLYLPQQSDIKDQSDLCVTQITGHWWQAVKPFPDCPSGPTFVPGG